MVTIGTLATAPGEKLKKSISLGGKFDLMDQNTKIKNLNPYVVYQNTEEWAIIAQLLERLVNNQDIELKTAPEYVIGYLVEKLRNKDQARLKHQRQPSQTPQIPSTL